MIGNKTVCEKTPPPIQKWKRWQDEIYGLQKIEEAGLLIKTHGQCI